MSKRGSAEAKKLDLAENKGRRALGLSPVVQQGTGAGIEEKLALEVTCSQSTDETGWERDQDEWKYIYIFNPQPGRECMQLEGMIIGSQSYFSVENFA